MPFHRKRARSTLPLRPCMARSLTSCSPTGSFDAGTTFDTSMNVAYLAAECKTNLDKTMFNEGLETSRALKQAVASARYLLICEWLDMKPIDTKLTPIA
jgi:hypothetical protein